MRRLFPALVLCVIASAPARADYPVAPDVVVFCEPTLRPVITEIGKKWTAQTGVAVRVFAAPNWANLARLAHHARDDVIIGEGDTAAAQNLIKGDTFLKLWRNKLVAVALSSEVQNSRAASPPAPLDLASVAGKAPVAIVDPGVAEAGKQTEAALQALGLWNAVSSKSIGVADTADAAFMLTNEVAKLAILYATDVAAHPDFTVTDTLPAADGEPIIYWAAQTQRALSPNASKFLEFLGRKDIRAQGGKASLEVLP